jgi:hypothetical protein
VVDARAAGLLPMLGNDLEMRPVSPDIFEVKAAFNAGRVLPFLSAANSEIGNALGQHVEVLSTGTSSLYWPRLQVPLTLRIKSAGLEVDFSAVAVMTLPELSVQLEGGDRILVKGKADTKNALGLTWEFEPAPDQSLYEIGLTKGEMSVGLAPGAKLTLRYKDVSSDGQGIGLLVTNFRVSRGGLDLDASVLDAPVLLNGLDLPFKFTEGGLSIRGGRITEAYIGGTGRMPPALVGDAPVTIGMRFAERGGRLALVGATAHLDRRDQPLVCESTRFRFSLTALGMDFQTDNGHHFYFLLTGSAQFKPSEGELPDGLLRFLPDVRIDLDAVPLAADVRVLARHISFQVALKPKKRFNLFKAFTFELRGFGFHPQCDAFGGDPAINLSGQISFADTGDVQKPSIDFHGLYIAGPDPEKGSSLPRVRCDRLGVELNTGAVRIRGSVAAVDGSLPTLFIPDALPSSFKVHGFLGNGELTIDGFASMSASIGFLEVDDGTETKRAFFLYLQKNRLSYKIPTPVVPLFLREVGFGFGYRYTLAGIKAAENSSSSQELIKRLDEIAKRQGELANFGAWAPDVEGSSPKVTLALRAAMSLTTASQEEVYNEKQEVELSNPFFFDITAALRSDFTFLMVIRGWLSVNYHDFHTGGPDLREKPTGYGYLYYNGPRGELLARCRNDPTGYIGKHPQLPSPLIEALRSIEYSSTLYMRPGLFHFELGWPNELRWSMEKGPLKIRCSGGMVYRYGDGALLHGINLQAYARLEVGGDSGGGSIGLSARAVAEFSAEARFITVIDIQNPSKSMLYGLMAFDACLRVAVSAWLRKKIGWVKIELNISFDFQIQISAAVEVAILAGDGLGARAQCRVSVRVFGATLGVSLALGFNEGALAEARARVQRYMALGLTVSSPASGSADGAVGDARVEDAAKVAPVLNPPRPAVAAPAAPPVDGGAPVQPGPLPPQPDPVPITDKGEFWWIARVCQNVPGLDPTQPWVLLFLLPKDGNFWAPPLRKGANDAVSHSLPDIPVPLRAALHAVRFASPQFQFDPVGEQFDSNVSWDAPIDAKLPEKGPKIDDLFQLSFVPGTTADVPYLDPQPIAVADHQPQTAPGATNDERTRERHAAYRRSEYKQRAGIIAAEHEARAAIMLQVVSDFGELATSWRTEHAGFLSLGLAFAISLKDYKEHWKLLENLQVRKRVRSGDPELQISACSTEVFQPPARFFSDVQGRPRLDPAKPTVNHSGIHLDWDLELPWQSRDRDALQVHRMDPDFWLGAYEVRRIILDLPAKAPSITRSKPCATVVDGEGPRELYRGDFQFTDSLSDLSESERLALLGTSDPDRAIACCVAWQDTFRNGEVSARVRYLVTPIDTAGNRGRTEAIEVRVPRPTPPVIGASATTLFEFSDLPNKLTGSRREQASLRSFVEIRDLAMPKPTEKADDPSANKPKKTADVRRRYRLILSIDDTLPIGSYGADAMLARSVVGAGQADLQASADREARPSAREIAFEFPEGEVSKLRARIGDSPVVGPGGRRPLRVAQPDLPDDKVVYVPLALGYLNLGEAPQQLLPADQESLLQVLWQGDRSGGIYPSRPAFRFFLETIVEVQSARGGASFEIRSPRVPVEIEMRLRPRKDSSAPWHVLRPEWFEWPVRMALDPLPEEDIHVETGFVHRKVPALYGHPGRDTTRASLRDLISADAADQTVPQVEQDPERRDRAALQVERDPERRIASVLRWNVGRSGDPMQTSLTAGYEVYELDLDEVPSVRKTESGLHVPPEWWKKVSEVQLIPREFADLHPSDTSDLPNWQCWYPSAAWRGWRESVKDSSIRSTAIQRGWFSAAESELRWPKAAARMTLLGDIVTADVDGLFADGIPDELLLTIKRLPTDRLSDAEKLLADKLGAQDLFPSPEWFAEAVPVVIEQPDTNVPIARVRMSTGKQLNLEVVRRVLRSLTWKSSALNLASSISQRVPLELGVVAVQSGEVCGRFKANTSTFGSLHPLLDEVLLRLPFAWSKAPGPDALDWRCKEMARRYVASIQSRMQPSATDLSAFFAATPAAQDPYGWGVLQMAGLSMSLRLFDESTGEFVPPRDLVDRLEVLLQTVLRSYRTALGDTEFTEVAGSPIVEALLRPMSTMQVTDFDVPVGAESGGSTDLLSESGLRLVQLSLRPRVVECRKYYALLLSGSGGSLTTGSPLRIVPPSVQGWKATTSQPWLQLELPAERVKATGGVDLARNSWRELKDPEGNVNDVQVVCIVRAQSEQQLPMFGVGTTVGAIAAGTWQPVPSLGEDVRALWMEVDPVLEETRSDLLSVFGRFSPIDVEDWAAEWTVEGKEKQRGFDRLGVHLTRRMDAFRRPSDKVDPSMVGRYLEWQQRFIEHGDLPWMSGSNVSDRGIAFALASPESLHPMRHAASNGTVELRRLHKDRWAHHRLYAVRPISRYAGVARASLQQISTPEIKSPSWAQAVTRRTERIATPVILGTSNQHPGAGGGSGPGRDWEFAVLAHPEQQLKDANRKLAANLEFEDVAVGFLREYRYVSWLNRLVGSGVVVKRPDPLPTLPSNSGDGDREVRDRLWNDPARVPVIDEPTLAGSVSRLPALYRGAELYRVSRLPFFYAVHLQAVARAGVVVSKVAQATQLDFAYQLPDPARLTLRPPRLTDGSFVIDIPWPCHRDLLNGDTVDDWFDPTPDAAAPSIADVPDPETGCIVFLDEIDSLGGSVSTQEVEIWPNPSGPELMSVRGSGRRWNADPAGPSMRAVTSTTFQVAVGLNPSDSKPRDMSVALAAGIEEILDGTADWLKRLDVPEEGRLGISLLRLPKDVEWDAFQNSAGAPSELVAHVRTLMRAKAWGNATHLRVRYLRGTAEPVDVKLSLAEAFG